jgi:hypothetical protein
MENVVSNRKFKVGQSVNYTSGRFGVAGSARGIYMITQLLPLTAHDSNRRRGSIKLQSNGTKIVLTVTEHGRRREDQLRSSVAFDKKIANVKRVLLERGFDTSGFDADF